MKPNHRGASDAGYVSLGWDTETTEGVPFTLQGASDEGAWIKYLRPVDFLSEFLRWGERYVRAGRAGGVVAWGHVLSFDLVALFGGARLDPKVAEFQNGQFEVRRGGARVEIFYGNNPFAKVTYAHGRVLWVIDTFAFTRTSLKKAAELFGLPWEKLPRPCGLGHRVLRGEAFERYAIRDAVLARALGQWLVDLHRKFDIGLTVSAAHFAGKVFAHNYLGDPWAPLPAEVEEGALLAYHGGKNGFYTRPGWVRDCREYDISSAYPWAMTQIPPLHHGDWFEVDRVESGYVGFYQVTGEVPQNEPYPCLFTHEFQPIRGRFSDTWVTSFELTEALRRREVSIEALRGYVWVPTRGGRGQDKPLARFARDFYKMKDEAEDPALRRMYKLILNSLYGKMIQLTEVKDADGDLVLKPGAYYRPDVASLITGAVRARIHSLEHRATSLHTATDAIHTRRTLPVRAGLGGLEVAVQGPCLLLRNKLYFHFSRDGTECKYALHGVQTSARHVWALLMKGKRAYQHTRLARPREAARAGIGPLQELTGWRRINIGEVKIRPVPRAAATFWRRGARV